MIRVASQTSDRIMIAYRRYERYKLRCALLSIWTIVLAIVGILTTLLSVLSRAEFIDFGPMSLWMRLGLGLFGGAAVIAAIACVNLRTHWAVYRDFALEEYQRECNFDVWNPSEG